MKLTEVLVCIAIFLLSCTVFLSSFAAVRKNAGKVVFQSEGVSKVITNDQFLRNEIKKINVPYWKNFKNHEKICNEEISKTGLEKGIEIVSVRQVYDKAYRSEGIKVEWVSGGKKYATQEFIKQRIIEKDE